MKETADAALVEGIEEILVTLPSIQAALSQATPKSGTTIIPGTTTFNFEDSLQVGNIHKSQDKALTSGDCVHEHICNIKGVSVTDEMSGIGNKLWDVVFVKESVMAVTDYDKKVVLLVDKQGHVFKDSHKQGVEFQDPRGIAYHPTHDCLVVCDRGADCLCILDPNTLSLTNKVFLVQFSPCGVSVMSNGYIALTDYNKQKVGVFNMNGTHVCSWDPYNNGASRVMNSWYVTVDKINQIYVADIAAGRIVKLSMTGEMVCEWKTDCSPYGLTVCGDQVLVAEDDSPECVREYSLGGTPGRDLITWDPDKGYGELMSVAVHNNQLAVIGACGLRMYKLTYE